MDRTTPPAQINGVGCDEFHVNERVDYPDFIQALTPEEFLAGSPADIRVRVANTSLPDQVELWIRPSGTGGFQAPLVMNRLQGNDYHASVASLAAGLYEFAVNSRTGDRTSTFPDGVSQRPNEWPFQTDALSTFRITRKGGIHIGDVERIQLTVYPNDEATGVAVESIRLDFGT